MKQHKNQRLFVQLHLDLLDTPAWRAMSVPARSLYVALKRRYQGKNNGELYLSHREAAVELGLARPTIARGFLELQHYGFIVMTSPGWLGVDGKGRAPHWRLTEIETTDSAATVEFKRWDGNRFKPPPPKPRKGKRRRRAGRRSELQQEVREQ